MGFSSLEIGKKALLAQKFGLDVTNNNIANVNTPGFSRRTAKLSETDPLRKNGSNFGTGVAAAGIQDYRHEFYDREIRTTVSRNQGYAVDEEVYGRIEAILAEPTDRGLNEVVNEFFNTFEELALNPEDLGLREYLIEQGISLSERFNTTAKQLIDLREETISKLSNNVSKVNTIIERISELNQNITNSKGVTTNEAQTYVDQRALLLEELSENMNVTISFNDNGSVNVFTNGINLITDQSYSTLKLNETINSATGERNVSIAKVDSRGNTVNTVDIQAGELASLIKHYNVTLDPNDTSNGLSVHQRIDKFANAIVQNVNLLTAGGYGLDDTGNIPPGRSFFKSNPAGVRAIDISVSDDIIDSPRDIPLSAMPSSPGDSTIARDIARLKYSGNFLEGLTPSEYYSSLLGNIGAKFQDAINGKNTTRLVKDQLESQRESVMGVNLDEEAVNLIKYQKAFEASSRVISTTNDILGVIVNLGR